MFMNTQTQDYHTIMDYTPSMLEIQLRTKSQKCDFSNISGSSEYSTISSVYSRASVTWTNMNQSLNQNLGQFLWIPVNSLQYHQNTDESQQGPLHHL